MKAIITIIILVGTLGWGPASEIVQLGQDNVTLANASCINRAAQLAAISGKPFDPSRQNTDAIIDQLRELDYLTKVDSIKMKKTAGRLRPAGFRYFETWADVELTSVK